MPVYEVKGAAPPQPERPDQKPAVPVEGIQPVIRIRRHTGKRPGAAREKGRGDHTGSTAGERALRQLVQRFNRHLERHHVPIHLVLREADGGFLLEVYDCSDRQVCRPLQDLEIGLAELPAWLHTLQQEAGLLVDTFS